MLKNRVQIKSFKISAISRKKVKHGLTSIGEKNYSRFISSSYDYKQIHKKLQSYTENQANEHD